MMSAGLDRLRTGLIQVMHAGEVNNYINTSLDRYNYSASCPRHPRNTTPQLGAAASPALILVNTVYNNESGQR